MAKVVNREELAGRPLCAVSVATISGLVPGTHILYKVIEEPYRPVYESALVAETKLGDGTVLLLRNNLNGVTKEWVDFSALKHLHVVIYTFCRYTDEEAIGRTTQRLEQEESNYNALLNNSHHFATWAKTGKEYVLHDIIEAIETIELVPDSGTPPMDPVLSKTEIQSLEEVKPGDHVMMITEYGGCRNILIKEVDLGQKTFTGYTLRSSIDLSQNHTGPTQIPGRTSFDRGQSSFNRGETYFDRGQTCFDRGQSCFNHSHSSGLSSGQSSGHSSGQSSGHSSGQSSGHSSGQSSFNCGQSSFNGGHSSFNGGHSSFNHGQSSVNDLPNQSKGSKIILKEYVWNLPGRTFKINYNDHQGLKPTEESLEKAEKALRDGSEWSEGDRFVTMMKTGTEYSFNDRSLFSGQNDPVSLTRITPEIAISTGDHLIVKNSKGDYCSVLVFKCLSPREIMAIPDPNDPEHFCSLLNLSRSYKIEISDKLDKCCNSLEQTNIFRVNYRQSLPPGEVVARACSNKGKEVLQASGERVDRYVSWAKTGKPVPVDIPALKQQKLCIALLRPQHRLKVLSMGDIQVGDHLIESNPTHWFHFMVTECNTDPTDPYKIKAIYCLRTSIWEKEITVDPGKQSIYKIDYPESFPTELAIERARSKLQTSGRKLSPLARQWFVRWAKTGSDEGIEVDFLENNAFPKTKSQIRAFSQLNPGDYLAKCAKGKMKPSCWHHCLVSSIHTPTKCAIVESWNGKISESIIYLDPYNVYYRLNYYDGACIHPESAISAAQALVHSIVIPNTKLSRQNFVNYMKTRDSTTVSLDTLYDDRLLLRRERVKSALDLRPGDHVERPLASSLPLVMKVLTKLGRQANHHMMVVEPINERECKVLHFSGPLNLEEVKLCSVVEEPVDLFKEGDSVFRIDYQERRHPAEGITDLRESVQLSQHNFVQHEGKYNLFTNNCETLVMRATVGVDTSIQVNEKLYHALQYSRNALIPGIASSTKCATTKGSIKAGAVAAKTGAAVSYAAINTIATGVVAGVAAGANVLIETPVFARGMYKLYRKQQFEYISDAEYAQGVTKQSFMSATAILGGVGGAIAGQLVIPVPVVGAAVGGGLGSFAGNAVGALIGKGAWKLSRTVVDEKTVNLPVIVNFTFSDFGDC